MFEMHQQKVYIGIFRLYVSLTLVHVYYKSFHHTNLDISLLRYFSCQGSYQYISLQGRRAGMSDSKNGGYTLVFVDWRRYRMMKMTEIYMDEKEGDKRDVWSRRWEREERVEYV
jgi:hypothetical protein